MLQDATKMKRGKEWGTHALMLESSGIVHIFLLWPRDATC